MGFFLVSLGMFTIWFLVMVISRYYVGLAEKAVNVMAAQLVWQRMFKAMAGFGVGASSNFHFDERFFTSEEGLYFVNKIPLLTTSNVLFGKFSFSFIFQIVFLNEKICRTSSNSFLITLDLLFLRCCSFCPSWWRHLYQSC